MKGLKRIGLVMMVMAVLLSVPMMAIAAVQFSEVSDNKIVGASADLGVTFSALTENDMAIIELQLNNKRITVQKGYNDRSHELYIQGISIESNEIATLSQEDSISISNLHSELLQYAGYSELGDTFLDTLNLLSSWPDTMPIVLTKDEKHPETKALSKSLCSDIGKTVNVAYPPSPDSLGGNWKSEATFIGTSTAGKCVGRCGIGCGSSIIGNADKYSVNCLVHDVCAGKYGRTAKACNKLFEDAADDFLAGKSCSRKVTPTTVNVKVGKTATATVNGDTSTYVTTTYFPLISSAKATVKGNTVTITGVRKGSSRIGVSGTSLVGTTYIDVTVSK
ncbi:MAG: hypothetical protein HQL05_07205 [Nitrospirae bacterium]|uniref:hypothetical protein n=1 Tax=Candidatus Magnetobacterium casense TaxID=1455061 RepID=UPI000AC77026|nr:hypothetical protein [Candidatus Magnetobacterium casensis]MBF0337607.1 hypothetical protein [Nitrospirota bacterium]